MSVSPERKRKICENVGKTLQKIAWHGRPSSPWPLEFVSLQTNYNSVNCELLVWCFPTLDTTPDMFVHVRHFVREMNGKADPACRILRLLLVISVTEIAEQAQEGRLGACGR